MKKLLVLFFALAIFIQPSFAEESVHTSNTQAVLSDPNADQTTSTSNSHTGSVNIVTSAPDVNVHYSNNTGVTHVSVNNSQPTQTPTQAPSVMPTIIYKVIYRTITATPTPTQEPTATPSAIITKAPTPMKKQEQKARPQYPN